MTHGILNLRRDDLEFERVLRSGKILQNGEVWIALPREVASGLFGSRALDSVIFELVRPESIIKPSSGKVFLKAIRSVHLAWTLMPGCAVLLNGFLHHWSVHWRRGFFSFLGVVFLQIAVIFLNDVEDHLRLIDLSRGLGKNGVIQKGWISAEEVQKLGYLALLLGSLCGLPVIFQSPSILAWIGLAGGVGAWGYSNQPFSFKYRIVGDFFLFLLGGPLLSVGLSQAIFGFFDISVVMIGLYFGLTVIAMSHAHHLQDLEIDRIYGIRTWAGTLGFKKSRVFLGFLYSMAFLCVSIPTLLGVFPVSVFLFCSLGLWGVIRLMRRVCIVSGPASALLGSIRTESSQLYFRLGLALCVGLGVGFWV